MKGYTADEAVGRSFAMFYTDDDRHQGLPMQLLLEARELGRVQHVGWRLRKDGSRFWGDVIITALHDNDGELAGFAKITRDRSDLKALGDAQDSFYAAISDDLRAPVTTLHGFADALRDALPEEREHFVQQVEANAATLMQMVEGLIRFATQRAGNQASRLMTSTSHG